MSDAEIHPLDVYFKEMTTDVEIQKCVMLILNKKINLICFTIGCQKCRDADFFF